MPGRPRVTADGITKRFGCTVALDTVTFGLHPGEIVGFLGANGAGKTTTITILAGLVPEFQGRACVEDFDVLSQGLEVKRRTGYVPETPLFYDCLSPVEHLEVTACLRGLSEAMFSFRSQHLLEVFSLTSVRDRPIGGLSKGTRQKLAIATALIHAPTVLLLDEPFNGLDLNAVRTAKRLLRESASNGATVLLSSHRVELMERFCSRILIIDRGRILADGTAAEICTAAGAPDLEVAFATLTDEGPARNSSRFV